MLFSAKKMSRLFNEGEVSLNTKKKYAVGLHRQNSIPVNPSHTRTLNNMHTDDE